MTLNVGTADRVARIVIGLALLGSPLAWYGPENINPWGYVGLAPLLSGLFGTCPLYSFMGWSTARPSISTGSVLTILPESIGALQRQYACRYTRDAPLNCHGVQAT